MIIKELNIKGVYEIQLEPISDDRGNFKRTYDDKIFSEYNLPTKWIQENHSYSAHKNTIRGLHFQFSPHSETKLVRVVNGEIYDVYLDLRNKSKTFGKWGSAILSYSNNKMILIPQGFAHGYCTLTDNCDVLYKVDNYYTPTKESGILWNDKDLNIRWKTDNPIISKKDSKLQTFGEFIENYDSLNIESSNRKILYYKDKNLD